MFGIRDQFIGFLDVLSEMDLTKTPNFVLFERLAKCPEARYPDPELVAARMKMDVSQEFLDDEELCERTIKEYVGALNRLWDALKDRFTVPQAERIFMEMATQFKIAYKFD